MGAVPTRRPTRVVVVVRSATVLVTDGNLRPSLAVVRSLGHAGYRVCVCAPGAHSLAGSSRHVAEHAVVPSALAEPGRYADAVAQLTRRWSVDLLFPMSEESMLSILPAAPRMAGVRIPFASLAAFRRASDKAAVMSLASSLGIAVPEQQILESVGALRDLDVSLLGFPLVLKPARSVAGEGGDRVKMGVTYADDAASLERQVRAMPAAGFPLLLQRRVEGPGTGIFLLIWEGLALAQFSHRRIREKPPSGGVSVCAESVGMDHEALAQSRALLDTLHWCGPAMIEFKQDRATGRHYLMEINGRFWGSLQLAIDAGVDFPVLLAAAALGESPPPVTRYDVGVCTHWWWGEVDHLIARLRGRADAPGMGSRATAVRAFLLPGWGVRNEVLRLDDPRPFLRETLEWLHRR